MRRCPSRKLIRHTIKPPTVRNDDAGRQLLEIVLPFHVLAVAQIAIQDYLWSTGFAMLTQFGPMIAETFALPGDHGPCLNKKPEQPATPTCGSRATTREYGLRS
jgi:hypothetical protein